MPRFAAIRLSSGLAIAGGVGALLFALLLTAGMLLLSPQFPGPLPPLALRAGGVLAGFLIAAFAVWSISSGIAVYRRRVWARFSMRVLGGALLLFGGTGLIGALLVPLATASASDDHLARVVRISLSVVYGLMGAVGGWWVALFGRPDTRRYFAEEPARWFPLSIGVIAWYLMAGGASSALIAVLGLPTPFFGWLAKGWTAAAVMTLWAAVQFYLGAALLELNDAARRWAIAFCVFASANALASALLPGPVRELQIEVYRSLRLGLPADAYSPGVLGALMGAVAMALPLWFLVRRRSAFR
jgi:hypothetical protein